MTQPICCQPMNVQCDKLTKTTTPAMVNLTWQKNWNNHNKSKNASITKYTTT